ncbi:MAG: GNAT family N-acetyltransferase [Balneolales bacterium]
MYIRVAEQKDIAELINIISSVFKEFDFIFDVNVELPDVINFKDFYGNSEHTLFVMEHNNNIVGCGALRLDKTGGIITRVYLKRKFRGQGLGKRLVNHLIDFAQESGAKHLSLWTDTRFTIAHNLYSSLGFSRTKKQRPLNDVNESYEIYFEMNLYKTRMHN